METLITCASILALSGFTVISFWIILRPEDY